MVGGDRYSRTGRVVLAWVCACVCLCLRTSTAETISDVAFSCSLFTCMYTRAETYASEKVWEHGKIR